MVRLLRLRNGGQGHERIELTSPKLSTPMTISKGLDFSTEIQPFIFNPNRSLCRLEVKASAYGKVLSLSYITSR